jgi:hypothetical protein
MVIKNETDFLHSSGNSSFRLIVGLIFLALIIALPSGVPAFFDGLPWTELPETLVVLLVIPFLLVLGWRFLSMRLCTIFLALILGLKVFAFIAVPSGGLLVKIKTNMPTEKLYWNAGYCQYVGGNNSDNLNSGQKLPNKCREHNLLPFYKEGWVKTYATAWSKNASGILTNPWTHKRNFPMDWTVSLPVDRFDKLKPTLIIEGVLILPEGKSFSIVAKGLEHGNLIAKNKLNHTFTLLPANTLEEASQQQYQLPTGGRWQLSGELKYSGKDWSLIPLLVEESGQVSSSLGRDTIWQDESALSMSLGEIQLYKCLSWVVDLSICMLFLIWGFWTIGFQIQKQVLTLSLALFSIVAASFPIVLSAQLTYLLKLVNIPDITMVSHLGISTTVAAVGFLIFSYWRDDYRSFQPDRIGFTIFLLIGPALLLFFTNKWWLDIGQWTWAWAVPNDWDGYQYYARGIIVGGEWLDGGESALMGRELYPYVIAISHALFGQSVFAQHMIDVWSVLGAAVLLANISIKFRLSLFTAYMTSVAFLMIFLIGSFRYHVGKSMSETTGMIFMLLAAWFMFRARERGGYRIILATIFGILGYWSRQDHLGVIAGLAFLTLEPIAGPTGGWKGYWERFKVKWMRLVCYWGGGIVFGIGILYLRNWIIGIGWYIAVPVPIIWDFKFEAILRGLYIVLTTGFWPHFPPLSGFVITFGSLVGLIALVWQRKPFLNFPVGVGVSILGVLIPYCVLFVVGSYPPRFSIHLLPLALLASMIFLNQYFKIIPSISKFNK